MRLIQILYIEIIYIKNIFIKGKKERPYGTQYSPICSLYMKVFHWKFPSGMIREDVQLQKISHEHCYQSQT